MTGFLQSLVARASGTSAPGPFQFATLPARPLPQAQTLESPPNMLDAIPAAPTHGPQEKSTPLNVITPESRPVARRAIAVERAAEPQAAGERPLTDVAPHAIPHNARAPRAVSPVLVQVPEPAPRMRETPAAPAQTLPSPPVNAASTLHTETIRIEHETSQEQIVTERREAFQNLDAEPPPRTSPFSPVPAEPLPAAGTVVEIGRIEIVLTQPPATPARQEQDRTRGFAGYEQRRLGPRR